MGISKNLAFYGLNPSPFSGREGYKEFLETPLCHFNEPIIVMLQFLTKANG